MQAIISDIHANRNALSVVLEHILGMEPDSIICLGDIVGYGPDPKWCVDAVRSTCDIVLCGNHEAALVYGSDDFNDEASSAIRYHRKMLMPGPDAGKESGARQRWNFLKGLPHRHAEGDRLFVHGSPRNPVREYLRPRDAELGCDEKLPENFALIDHVAFVGHTHRPGIFTDNCQFQYPKDLGGSYPLPEQQKIIVNVGSVGQPRDGDVRACYVTLEDDAIEYHRLEYDHEDTARRVEQSGLGIKLAERLRAGQ